MSRVYVGNLEPKVTIRDLEDDFRVYGVIRSIWVARRPPGYAFIDFDDRRDADDAIREMDGRHGWKVQLSHKGTGGSRGVGGRGRDRHGSSELKCYECGEPGHFARACQSRISPGGVGGGHRRIPSPKFRRSPSYGRRSNSPRDRSPRRRSLSPRRDRSPRRRSLSPSRGRSDSRSPPKPNGNDAGNGRQRTRSRSRSQVSQAGAII